MKNRLHFYADGFVRSFGRLAVGRNSFLLLWGKRDLPMFFLKLRDAHSDEIENLSVCRPPLVSAYIMQLCMQLCINSDA